MVSESKESEGVLRKVLAVPRWKSPIASAHIRMGPPPEDVFAVLTGAVAAPGTAAVPATPAVPRAPRVAAAPAMGAAGAASAADEAAAPRAPRAAAGAAAPAPAALAVELSPEVAQVKTDLERATAVPKVQVKPEVFVPSNRRAFKQFIIQTYRRYALPPPAAPDPDACAKAAAAAAKSEVKTFAYQSFVRDYIQRPSPYRGVLVYHGLGSGKTCTSIASFEALYQMGQKPVYVMTPASLSPNYRDEITKCGPFVFRTNNHWTWVSVPSLAAPSQESELLLKVLGLPLYSVRRRKGGWLPVPTKPANFDSLSNEQRASIQEQIKEHMDARIQFIHYNGITETTIRDWACNTPNMFDGATVVIDEVHNLVRKINNSDLEVFYKIEPRSLAQYNPVNCGTGKRYRIAYLLYRMLCNAVGCKIIALSATPIINFAQEVAILANLLAGDTRMAEFNVPNLDKREAILRILERHPEVDFAEVVPRPEVNTSTVRITPVPTNCRKVIDPATGAFRGFVRVDGAAATEAELGRERALDAWAARVVEAIKAVSSVGEVKFTSVTRLPDLEKQFTNVFVDTERLEIKEEMRLPMMARLSGLVSYYKGGKEDLMAKVNKDVVVEIDMSDLQLKRYTEERKPEIDRELRQSKSGAPAAAGGAGAPAQTMYDRVKKSVNSTFKIFSRAACNFAFPEEVARPVPADYRDQLRMLGVQAGAAAAAAEGAEAEEAVEDAEIDMEAAEGGAAAPPAAATGLSKTYSDAIQAAIRTLRARGVEFFAKGKLQQYSPKFQAILDRLTESRGPALVYSNFKTLEGVGLFGVALEAQQGFARFDIVQTAGGAWEIAPETLAAGPDVPRYISYTGDEDRMKRSILLAIFNGKWGKVPGALAASIKTFTGLTQNLDGKLIKVFMITQSGAEGISLANVRQVHIMEPYWNYVRIDQVKGRAIRICSHMDLPPAERTVDVFTYVVKFSEKQIKERTVDETLINFDEGKTTDQSIFELLNAKKHLADSVSDIMKTSAVDCELNATENGTLACYRFAGSPSMEPMFHPILESHLTEAAASVRVRK